MKSPKFINILIACEESQTICKEFRKYGYNAFSCDIQKCSGGLPEYHINDDVMKYVNKKDFEFYTESNDVYYIDSWDLIIAHPPCTFITKASAVELHKHPERFYKGLSAVLFFRRLLNADCKYIAIENPIPLKIFKLPKYSQIIYMYQFGENACKPTCLWLKNLPKLQPTKIVKYDTSIRYYKGVKKSCSRWYNKNGGSEHSKNRSKTFQGVAEAIVKQWGGYLSENL